MKYSLRSLIIATILVPPLLALAYFATRPTPFGFSDFRILLVWATTLLVAVGLIATSFYQAVTHRP
ncbi:MAG: hypothetical protein K8R36_09490 [Planctomycetales bacterium]|nr:hypothetical protein [Planctomycetales bacterium]